MSLIKTGPNSMKLGGHNTYSGGTYLIQGRVQLTGTEETGTANPTQVADGRGTAGTAMTAANLSNPSGFGTGPVYIFPGAQVFPSGISNANSPASNTIPNDFFFAGSGFAAENDGAFRLGNVILSGKMTLIGDGMICGATATLTNQITGNFNLDLGTATTINTTLILSNTSTTAAAAGTVSGLVSTSNWKGNTTINGASGRTNLIQLGAAEQIPSGVGFGNLIMIGGGSTTLNLGGFNQSLNGLSTATSSVGVTITNNTLNAHSGAALLTVGGNNQTASFGGAISDGSSWRYLTG